MDDPTSSRTRRRSARDAVLLVVVGVVLLVVLQGPAIERAGEKMRPGVPRDVVEAVGGPAGAIGGALPFAGAADAMVGWLSPDEDLGRSDEGFDVTASDAGAGRVSPEAFAGTGLDGAPRPRPLQRLLVTGDSMSMPLDVTLARALTPAGVRTTRDAHVGTGISKTGLIDWGRLAAEQARERPDAVVMFIGANEGFPMTAGGRELPCCGAAWAAEYATRVRGMLDGYGVGRGTRVYWVTLPTPRSEELRKVTSVVNQAVHVATSGYGAAVRLIDAEALLTPGGRFRSAMELGDRLRIVREPDGVHLSELGAEVLGARVLDALRRDFAVSGATR